MFPTWLYWYQTWFRYYMLAIYIILRWKLSVKSLFYCISKQFYVILQISLMANLIKFLCLLSWLSYKQHIHSWIQKNYWKRTSDFCEFKSIHQNLEACIATNGIKYRRRSDIFIFNLVSIIRKAKQAEVVNIPPADMSSIFRSCASPSFMHELVAAGISLRRGSYDDFYAYKRSIILCSSSSLISLMSLVGHKDRASNSSGRLVAPPKKQMVTSYTSTDIEIAG